MSVKSLLLGLTTVATATAGLLVSAPTASALSIGDSYNVAGEGIFSSDSIDFTNDGKVVVFGATGGFASIGSGFDLAIAKDIASINSINSTPQKLIDFTDSNNDQFDFTATKAFFDPGTQSYRFGGFFGSTPKENGDGELDALQFVFANNATQEAGFVGTFTVIPEDAIPTPALLPGIIGMGIAAVRKRREDGEAEA